LVDDLFHDYHHRYPVQKLEIMSVYSGLFLGCTIGAIISFACILAGLIPPDHTPTVLTQGLVTAIALIMVSDDDD
jgi:hypothetical protein